MGDIDLFKNVNDNYGHGTGDEVLCVVACRLGGSVRSYDAVRRHDGEEFLIVLNGCRTRMAASRAEAIRRVIDERPVETAAGTLAISMSLGVAGTEDWQDANPKQLIKEANVALYRAKELGRNRSEITKPPGLQGIQMSSLAKDKVPAR
jgi:two-component system cell cycle response regulator